MIATNQDDRKLGKALFTRGENQYSLHLDAVAFQLTYHGAWAERNLMVISACGPGTAVKACGAMLQDKNLRGSITVYDLPELQTERLSLGAYGFRCAQHRLGYDTWHLLAVSKIPGLMANFSPRSVYLKLRSDAYTTPILRQWMPWLTATLMDRQLLGPLECYGNCQSGLLTATIEQLDEAVRDGIVGGHLALTQEDTSWPRATTD